MKKRTKITLRTTIYLTIVGLLALTGVFYAANPSQRATVPKSVAAPDVPAVAHPTPFAILPGPVGVAAVPESVLATGFSDKISVGSTATGLSRWWRRSRVLSGCPPSKNTWLSLQFSPRRPGSPRATFSSHKKMTSLSSREVSSRRLRRFRMPPLGPHLGYVRPCGHHLGTT